MSQSGALAATRRMGVASGVQRFNPALLRNRPVAVWVRGSIGTPHCNCGRRPPPRSGRHRQADAAPALERFALRVHVEAGSAHGATHVLIDRVERIRLELGQIFSEDLFDPVNLVEVLAAIDSQKPHAGYGIGPQQKHIAEKLVLPFIQRTARGQAEIGRILFVLERVAAIPARARIVSERHSARLAGAAFEFPKTAITGPEDSKKNTWARFLHSPTKNTHAVAIAMPTRGQCKADGARSIPVHSLCPSSAAPVGWLPYDNSTKIHQAFEFVNRIQTSGSEIPFRIVLFR